MTMSQLVKSGALETGFSSIDRILGGLRPGQVMTMGSRPSMGKTTLALDVAAKVSGRKDATVVLFSLELTKEEVSVRLLAQGANFSAERLKSGNLTKNEWARLAHSSEKLSSSGLFIDDSPNVTVDEIGERCVTLKQERGTLDLVVVDYFQLINARREVIQAGQFEERDFAEIMRGLKQVAGILDCPVILLSQINRGVEGRENKRPLLSDLRGPSAVEQESDVVMFVYRDDFYNKESAEKGYAEIIIAKNMGGRTGTVRLKFRQEPWGFEEVE
ncbi:DnaB-like helicase C-terminal domain-containing protein [Bdellovibrionota bacterium FG-2]